MACAKKVRKYDYAGSERIRVRGTTGGANTFGPGSTLFTAGDMFSPVLTFADLGSCNCGDEHGSGLIESVIITENISTDPVEASGFQEPDLTLWLTNVTPGTVPAVNDPMSGITILNNELVAIVPLGGIVWHEVNSGMSVGQLAVSVPYIIPSGTLYGFLVVNDAPDWTQSTTAFSIDIFATKD